MPRIQTKGGLAAHGVAAGRVSKSGATHSSESSLTTSPQPARTVARSTINGVGQDVSET